MQTVIHAAPLQGPIHDENLDDDNAAASKLCDENIFDLINSSMDMRSVGCIRTLSRMDWL